MVTSFLWVMYVSLKMLITLIILLHNFAKQIITKFNSQVHRSVYRSWLKRDYIFFSIISCKFKDIPRGCNFSPTVCEIFSKAFYQHFQRVAERFAVFHFHEVVVHTNLCKHSCNGRGACVVDVGYFQSYSRVGATNWKFIPHLPRVPSPWKGMIILDTL